MRAGRATMGVLAAVVVVPLLLGAVQPSCGPGPGLSDAPRGLVVVADRAAAATGADRSVLLAIAKVESSYGRYQAGQPDSLVPAEIRARVDTTSLAPGGATATLLALPDGRRIGDWVNPRPVGREHAMGFLQFLPSTWRQEARLAPGRPQDPYDPYQSMVAAGSYLQRLQSGAVGGHRRSLREAIAAYGGSDWYADDVLRLTTATA
jgi:soluble lytic murein transglycosylase-like protein